MSVPVNKDSFDSIIVQLLDAANHKPGTFTLDRAHALSKQVKILASADEDAQKSNARKEVVRGVLRGHENGAYGISDSGYAYEALTFYASGAMDEKSETTEPI